MHSTVTKRQWGEQGPWVQVQHAPLVPNTTRHSGKPEPLHTSALLSAADPGPGAQERARFEADALREQARHAPAHVPAVHRFDAQLALIVMQFLPPPAAIARGLLNAGAVLPALPRHAAGFMAATLFHTSLFALDSTRWRCACMHMLCL